MPFPVAGGAVSAGVVSPGASVAGGSVAGGSVTGGSVTGGSVAGRFLDRFGRGRLRCLGGRRLGDRVGDIDLGFFEVALQHLELGDEILHGLLVEGLGDRVEVVDLEP